jgi:hypothetical protein
MLYISNYDKYNLDKSSQSMYAYYTRLINDINTNILEIRDYLVNMLDVVAKLRARLYDIKDSIQEDLNKTKDAYEDAGYTNGALDKVQEILDGAEDDLQGLEQGVQSTIDAIDCNEVPEGCNYVEDCMEGCNEAEPVQPPEQPKDGGDFNPDDCSYCAFRASGTEGTYTCIHCDHGDCNVNTTCGEPVDEKPWSYPGEKDPNCTYVVALEPGCGQLIHTDGDCNEVTCTYKGGGCDFANDCTYTCQWGGTECGEASLPEDCTFSCQDQTVCNYDGSCQECTYSSEYCGEEYGCNETCVFDDSSCTYDSSGSCSYDSENGFDYGCNEWADDCRESADCSEGSSDDDSNVVCTYLIKRLFNSDSKLLDMSRENVKIGLRNGLNKKAFKEYYNGLGLEIIEHLKHETDDSLMALWINSIKPVWTLLRTDPKSGVKAYTDFIISSAEQYHINWRKYKNVLIQYESCC